MDDILLHESELRKLISRYCHFYDDGRPQDFADLFAEDAEFVVFGNVVSGRDAIRDRIGTQTTDQPPGQHITFNVVLEIETTGVTARGRTDFCYLTKRSDGLTISQAGRYHDHFVRSDEWRIAKRTVVFLGEPAPEDV